jgi:hypothetical protein
MTKTDLFSHYGICGIAAILVGCYVGQHSTPLGIGLGFATFLAVSGIQVYDREHSSNRHNEPLDHNQH